MNHLTNHAWRPSSSRRQRVTYRLPRMRPTQSARASDKLNRAIEALGTPIKRRGRPPKNPFAATITAPVKTAARRSGLSPAKRKAQSVRMKAYWAKRSKESSR